MHLLCLQRQSVTQRCTLEDRRASTCYCAVHCGIVRPCRDRNPQESSGTPFASSEPRPSAFAAIKAQLHAKSDNEVFDYLVTVAADQRDDLVQLVYGLFGNLADNLTHRFQSLETVSQLHLALTDSYIKYALTALPEVPQSFLAGARARAALIYEQVNLTAAREFQRRRDSGAYSPNALGLEDGPPEPPSGVSEG
jgi:hypothetical protein